MYSIRLVVIGRVSKGPLGELTAEYLKRLGAYAKVEIKEVKEEAFRSVDERGRVLKEEAERMEKALAQDAYTIILSAEGKGMASEEFAKALEKWSEHGARKIQFVIGGPLGLADSIKERADLLFSLSPLTFPHDLARVLLLEQLYRGITIKKGKTYHY
jgi:23S rRNA (pseudouridine1915-N3)-methyltransferase